MLHVDDNARCVGNLLILHNELGAVPLVHLQRNVVTERKLRIRVAVALVHASARAAARRRRAAAANRPNVVLRR